jgi:hypothetical protein
MQIHLPFDNSRSISSVLSIIFLFVLAAGVAFLTVNAALDLVVSLKQSALTNPGLRPGSESLVR